jgi:hypothetical protein
MYEKYRLLKLTATKDAQWKEIIVLKKLQEQRHLCTLSPKPFLRKTTPECHKTPVASKKPTVHLHAKTKYKETRSLESTRNTVEPRPVVSLYLEQCYQQSRLRYLSTMLAS